MRALITAVAAALIAAMAASAAAIEPAVAQTGFNRPGGDYATAPVLTGDPAACAARCERERGCRSWSCSYPMASEQRAMCSLKREVMPRVKSSCCVSGVHGAGVIQPLLDDFEYSIDRIGADYRSFDTSPDSRGWPCAMACRAESHCRAWTYRRLGYGTTAARCYLKNAIKPPHPRPCCISGVVR